MADDIIEEPAPVLEPTPPSKPAITMPADPNTLPVRQLKTLREFTAPATPPAIRARTFTVGSVINGADFAGPYIEEMVRQGYIAWIDSTEVHVDVKSTVKTLKTK